MILWLRGSCHHGSPRQSVGGGGTSLHLGQWMRVFVKREGLSFSLEAWVLCRGGGFNPDYIINTCVMSVLLYGCENWILKGTLVDKLHCFLGDEGGVGDIAGNVSRECWRSVGRSQS